MLLTILYMALRHWVGNRALHGNRFIFDVWSDAVLQQCVAALAPGWFFVCVVVVKGLLRVTSLLRQ